jgi:Arginine deiminase
MMHLDTVMTMIDRDTFVLYPYIEKNLRSWTVIPGDEPGGLHIRHNRNLWDTLAEAMGAEKLTVLTTDEDIRAAEREQWDDGNNYLAAPLPSEPAAVHPGRGRRSLAPVTSDPRSTIRSGPRSRRPASRARGVGRCHGVVRMRKSTADRIIRLRDGGAWPH